MKIIFPLIHCFWFVCVALGSSSEKPRKLTEIKNEIEISIRDYLRKRPRSMTPEFKLHFLIESDKLKRVPNETDEEFELRKKENELHDFETEIGLFRVAKSSDRARLRKLPERELKALLKLIKRYYVMQFAMG